LKFNLNDASKSVGHFDERINMKVNSITSVAVATMFIRSVSTRLMLLLMVLMAPMPAFAQTASFTYQGKLSDSGNPANGNYDLQFKLYDALTGGGQIGVRMRTDVPVTGGIFTVQLDFAVGGFSGLDRFLEIGVRPAGSPNPFTILSPRQPITSTPYAFHSLSSEFADVATTATNANQLGVAAANQYVLTTDARMTDARSPTAGSTSYIQNTNSPQTGANFNISGNGALGALSATGGINTAMQYNIGGNRVLSVAGTSNTFGGVGAGNANTTGRFNSFFGTNAGFSNTTGESNSFFGTASGPTNGAGASNSFFGYLSGNQNSSGSSNSFFGDSAGFANTTASGNSFFGANAGQANSTGYDNAFFGSTAGQANTTGFENAFFGAFAGQNNITNSDFLTGSLNSFFGAYSGQTNTTGNANSFFGAAAGTKNTTGGFNSFFGQATGYANTTGSSNAFFGDEAGKNNTSAGNNSFFGEAAGLVNTTGSSNSFFGALAGYNNSTANDNSFFGVGAGDSTTTGGANSCVGSGAGGGNTTGTANVFVGFHTGLTNTSGDNNAIIGANADVGVNNLNFATAIGAGAVVSSSNTIVLGRADGSDFVRIPGLLTIPNLAAAGMTQLCRNSFDRVGDCSSSLRYKTNLAPYRSGLSIVNRLRPISFTWKEGGMRDLGFGAEDVEKIDRLLVTYNSQGQVEGVKYDRINVVLVNAVRELQDQIEKQQRQIKQQQTQLEQQRLQIESLTHLFCLEHPNANLCH